MIAAFARASRVLRNAGPSRVGQARGIVPEEHDVAGRQPDAVPPVTATARWRSRGMPRTTRAWCGACWSSSRPTATRRGSSGRCNSSAGRTNCSGTTPRAAGIRPPARTRRVILRMKDDYDGAEPSATSVSVGNLIVLAHLTGDADWRARVERTFQGAAARIDGAGRSVPMMLAGLSAWHAGVQQIAIVGAAGDAAREALERRCRDDTCRSRWSCQSSPASGSGGLRRLRRLLAR